MIIQTTAIIIAGLNNHVVRFNIEVIQFTTQSVIELISELSKATFEPETVNWVNKDRAVNHNAGTKAKNFFIFLRNIEIKFLTH